MEDTFPPGDRLKDLLNQEGFRFTQQRQKILTLFMYRSDRQHFTAEEIRECLAQQGENISLSTVYRTLHVMAGLGVLRELELTKDKKSYELNTPQQGHHHHLVCVQCGMVLEFEEERVARIGNHQTDLRGYLLIDCKLIIYGICPQCRSI